MPAAGPSQLRSPLARFMALGPISCFALTLLSAALFWSGTIRGDATPYGDGSRIMPWLTFVRSQADWPTWNPFRNGGYPLFADAEAFWFLIPFVDPSSPYANLSLNLTLFAALLLLIPPVWLAARRLGLTPPWAAAATLLAVSSEGMVLAEQSARFGQLFSVAAFAWIVAILLKPKPSISDYLALAFGTGVWLTLGLQYAIVPGLAIWSAFVTSDAGRLGWLKGLAAGTGRAVLIGIAALALSAVVALPVVAHFSSAYLPQGLQYEPVVTASWSQAGRFLLPSLPGLPVFMTFIALPAMLIAAMHREHGGRRIHSSMRALWALLLFLGLFVIMCLPGIGPVVATAYEHAPILSSVRQLVGMALIIGLLTSLWAIGVFQAVARIPFSSLRQSARLLLAAYFAASAASIFSNIGSAPLLGSVAVAGVLVLLAIGSLLSVTAPALMRSFDPPAGLLGAMLVLLSIGLVLPTAFVEALPGTKRLIHVANTVEQPEASALILADQTAYFTTLKPGATGLWHLHSQRRMGTGFSLFYPMSFAYTLAYLSPAFDLTQQRPHWVGTTSCNDLDSRALDMLAVRYLLCRPADLEKKLPPGFAPAIEGPSKRGYVLLRRVPGDESSLRVFCRWRAERVPSPAGARELTLTAFERGIVLLPADQSGIASAAGQAGSLDADCPASATANVTVSMIKDASNEMRLEATSDRAGLLVIPDNLQPGWTATVNGTAVGLERAFFAYRGVPVARGRNEIRLVYSDPYLRTGLAISGATFAALLMFAAALAVRKSRVST